MSSGKNPLMLMMALSVPGAAHALGLGDIHVDSALNERFAAEIDIVGATALELAELRASVANRDIFSRFGAERPAFLSSATFKVTQDAQGRPVLAVRSTEAFTDPVVNFLVDLNWHNGELVRQYTLLLDPADFGTSRVAGAVPAGISVPAAANVTTTINASAAVNTPAAVSAPAAANAPTAVSAPATVNTHRADNAAALADARAARKTTHLKVGAKATLRGIAWRVGERSESDLQRMMIAIFRANPSAFDGNINRLHRGAVLTIPAHAELAAIPRAEAKREFHAQMMAWRSSAPMTASNPARPAMAAPAETVAPAVSTAAVPAAAIPAAAVGAAAVAPAADPEATVSQAASASPVTETLERRVQSLEQELNDVKGVLQSKHDEVLAMQEAVARAETPAPAAAPALTSPVADAPPLQSKSDFTAFSIAAGLGLLASALAALYLKLRRRPLPPAAALVDLDPVAADPKAEVPKTAIRAAIESAADAEPRTAVAMEETTGTPAATAQDILEGASNLPTQEELEAIEKTYIDESTQPLLPIVSTGEPARYSTLAAGSASRTAAHEPTVSLRIDPTRLDYNLVDLDMTAQHVQMPSVLNEQVVMKERRTNLADVLKLAIEREPDRHDLRMKLLELYYSAAATNRQAFLEVVQKFARDRDYLQSEQWDKIAFMGRQIAAENPLFTEETADDDIADCA